MGVLRWTPAEFWRSTPHDLFAALDGRFEAMGGKRQAPAMSEDRLQDMLDRFPDEHPDPMLVN